MVPKFDLCFVITETLMKSYRSTYLVLIALENLKCFYFMQSNSANFLEDARSSNIDLFDSILKYLLQQYQTILHRHFFNKARLFLRSQK